MTKSMIRAAATLVLAGSLALLTACSSLFLPGQGTPPRLFDLSPKSTFPKDLPKVDWQLVVEIPVAARSLSTSRIALMRRNMTLDYYSEAAWTDVAPQLVQTRLIESFENTGKIISVGRESVSLRADYLLKTELREFEAIYDGPGAPAVLVRINAKLVKMPQRQIIASTTASAKIKAAADDLDAIVTAFDTALGKVLKRVVIFTMRAPGKISKGS